MKLKIQILSVLFSILFSGTLFAEEISEEAKKHVNPMPDLILVVEKMGDKLGLNEKQLAKLKKWQDERGPVEEKLIKEILKAEEDIYTASLENEPLSRIDQLGSSILQNRLMLIRNKAFTREKIKEVLDGAQWKQLIELYKANYKK